MFITNLGTFKTKHLNKKSLESEIKKDNLQV